MPTPEQRVRATELARQWRRAHPEAVKKAKLRYQSRHKEQIRESKQRWYAKNRESSLARSHNNYFKDADFSRARGRHFSMRRYWKLREIVNDAKRRPCADCRNRFHSCAMDFDHVRGVKSFCIGVSVGSKSAEVLLEEIAKCDVVCSNCHRLRTHNRRVARIAAA